MAVTHTEYTSYKDDLLEGTVDLTNDTIKVMLVSSSYTFDAGHDFVDDITNEVSGTGYTAGGETVTTPTVTAGVFDAADTTWTNTTITEIRGVVLYKDTGTPATSPLISFIDNGANLATSGNDFKIAWDATGIISIS